MTEVPTKVTSPAPALPVAHGDWSDPTSLAEARDIAKILANSQMVPNDYRGKPDAILATAIFGRALGLGMLASLQGIANVNGRPVIWGDTMLAVVQTHPHFDGMEERVETDPEKVGETTWKGNRIANWTAICTVRRKGRQPVVVTFSVEDAIRAGLWGKAGPWTTHPQRMLRYKARNFACRDQFADALKGLQCGEVAMEEVEEATVVAVRDVEEAPVSSSERLLQKIAPEAEPEMPDAAQAKQEKPAKKARKAKADPKPAPTAEPEPEVEAVEEPLGDEWQGKTREEWARELAQFAEAKRMRRTEVLEFAAEKLERTIDGRSPMTAEELHFVLGELRLRHGEVGDG